MPPRPPNEIGKGALEAMVGSASGGAEGGAKGGAEGVEPLLHAGEAAEAGARLAGVLPEAFADAGPPGTPCFPAFSHVFSWCSWFFPWIFMDFHVFFMDFRWRRCACEHWKVIHTFVFARAPSRLHTLFSTPTWPRCAPRPPWRVSRWRCCGRATCCAPRCWRAGLGTRSGPSWAAKRRCGPKSPPSAPTSWRSATRWGCKRCRCGAWPTAHRDMERQASGRD